MIYVHSLGRAARYYADRTALAPETIPRRFGNSMGVLKASRPHSLNRVSDLETASPFFSPMDPSTSSWSTPVRGWE